MPRRGKSFVQLRGALDLLQRIFRATEFRERVARFGAGAGRFRVEPSRRLRVLKRQPVVDLLSCRRARRKITCFVSGKSESASPRFEKFGRRAPSRICRWTASVRMSRRGEMDQREGEKFRALRPRSNFAAASASSKASSNPAAQNKPGPTPCKPDRRRHRQRRIELANIRGNLPICSAASRRVELGSSTPGPAPWRSSNASCQR